MKKRILSLFMAVALVLSMVTGTAFAASADSVTISATAQMYGGFILPPQLNLIVEPDCAEKYGFTDSIKDGASALDALVKIHELTFADAFTPELASEFLVCSGGFVSKVFGVDTNAFGFVLNGMYPHDGTESPYGGYNGTLLTTQKINNDDLLEFFVYQDSDYWSDCISWFEYDNGDAPSISVEPGSNVSLTLKSFVYMGGYACKDREALRAKGKAYEDAQGAWVSIETGELTDITGCVSDANGVLTLTAPKDSGEYYFTAYSKMEDPDTDTPIVMSLLKIIVSDKSAPLSIAPDRVDDYLCIGSQYTNKEYGTNPESTLTGGLKSLGNFGGYITYYYENPIVNSPLSKYGIDFYVYGNAFSSGGSAAEIGQVYVSEDGEKWYALAGSEHYEKTAHWDYEITYTKTKDGKAEWTDSLGNSMTNEATMWPSYENYPLNKVGSSDSYTFRGIAFDSAQGSITGDGTAGAEVCPIKFGYVDYYQNGEIGADVNPYTENPQNSNGFDLEWAVDENGTPIDVSDMEFHYIKIATASNIWAGALGEKSTEVTAMARAAAAESEVGKTKSPEKVLITDGKNTKEVVLDSSKKVYDVALGDMEYISIGVEGAADNSNIYINNQRISGQSADGFRVTRTAVPVRIIVQSGEAEPCIYLLRLTSDAEDGLIREIKAEAGGKAQTLDTTDGTKYTLSVGSGTSKISLTPIVQSGVSVKINGEEVKTSYSLSYGKNEFTILADDGNGKTQEATVVITRASSSVSDKDISVSFTLYGDEKHGSGGKRHTYTKTRSELEKWVDKKSVSVPLGSSVLDVFKKVMAEVNMEYKGTDSYISEINGLAELDNGPASGWMYLLNGKYPSLDVSKQTVKNGDSIIFHYTDDYKSESDKKVSGGSSGGSGSGGGSSSFAPTDKTEDLPAVTPSAPKISDFTDITADDWYYGSVSEAVSSGLMKGVSDTSFAPLEYVTRGMFVTILYRLDGEPEVGELSFTDVSEGDYYCAPVIWAKDSGVVNGTSESEFSPNLEITREELATMLYRYYKAKNNIAADGFDLGAYTDSGDISAFAADAMSWACQAKIIRGYDDGTLRPGAFASRAEIAAILTRIK